MIYFAYGSNMDEARMRQRCSSARFLFKAKLPNFRLAFTRFSRTNGCGAADILPEGCEAVWGVVYHIKDEQRGALEKAEGVPVGAYKPFTADVHPDGDRAQRIKAATYVVVTKENPCPKPSPAYKEHLVNGAIQWGLPEDYIARLRKIETS
jgi:cation transport regulator ChaC